MGFFFKKQSKKAETCCCGGSCGCQTSSESISGSIESVQVLGSGCAKCNALEKAVQDALNDLGISVSIQHVTDFAQISALGVMTTPALVINGKVLSYGKVLKKEEVIALLNQQKGSPSCQ